MARPVVTATAEELYEALGPLAVGDENNGWHLLNYVAALVSPAQEIEDLVRDTDTYPGWSSVLDIDRVPATAIGWLGQFIGVSVPDELPTASKRLRVKETAGFQRGTPASIAGAARQYLTGGKLVRITERDTSAYHFKVVTFLAETPSSAKVLAALLEQKPAGLQMTYEVSSGQTYAELKTTGLTYAQLGSTYPTYSDMKLSVPA